MRQPRLGRHSLGLPVALILTALLALALIAPGALAREKKVAFVDDDWDPIERGPGDADPHYETYFFEVFDILGYDFDVFEIQPDEGPRNLPTLEDLAAYPYVIWNCASADSIPLSIAERMLLRDYRALGGKLMLVGQGIVNALAPPDLRDFLYHELGVEDYAVDVHVVGIKPTDDLGYFPEMGWTGLDTSNLPDPDPARGDLLVPAPDVISLLTGSLSDSSSGPVSTNRYLPAPLHFQSVMMEAIADPYARADFTGGYSEWLGFEGDDIMDFMDGLEDLEPVSICPPHELDWDPILHAIRFAAHGEATCDAVLAMPLMPEGGGCDSWSIRFSHLVSAPGAQSEMVLLELAGGLDVLRVLAIPSTFGDQTYDLRFKFLHDGHLVLDQRFPNLSINEIRRVQVSQYTPSALIGIEIKDQLGNFVDGATFSGYALAIEELRLRARGLGHPAAEPVEGWVDDIAIGGCLITRFTTGVGETPLLLGSLRVQPNPFNPSTRISGELLAAGGVELGVYDLQGRRQRLLIAGDQPAGPFSLEWDGRDESGQRLPSGVYLLRLTDGRGSRAVKLVMMK